MDEHKDRKEFIIKHLSDLCVCTTIGIDFINCLLSKNLIEIRDSQVLVRFIFMSNFDEVKMYSSL